MLNYTSKWINTVSFFVTIILSVILFAILDISIFKNNNRLNNQISNVSVIYQNKYVIAKKRNIKTNLNDKLLELLQVSNIDYNVNKSKTITNKKEKETYSKQKEIENIWRIEIPKIGLIAPIKSGTTQEILATAVGHFNESQKWNGNVALAGHNRGYNCNFFQNIKKLKKGDKIIYYTENGKREYSVEMNEIIYQTDWRYIEDTIDNRITLITCVENMYEYRRCVQAKEII